MRVGSNRFSARTLGWRVVAGALALAVGSIAMSQIVDADVVFVQAGADISGAYDGDLFGAAVALSADGNRIAIGAPAGTSNTSTPGRVRVYDWDGTTWIQAGADIQGTHNHDHFGDGVGMSADGNRIAIASLGTSSADPGGVRVYDWDGTTWIQAGSDISENWDEGWSAVALSSDGNRVAMGDQSQEPRGLATGLVRAYDWDGTTWIQAGTDVNGQEAEEFFGSAVALTSSGNRLAIGAPGNPNAVGGRTRVYDWDGTTWIQAGTDINGHDIADVSGAAVALSSSGNRLAIGAPGDWKTPPRIGRARVYDWDGTTWIQSGADINGETTGDRFGSAIAMSSDGSRIAIGAPGNQLAGRTSVYDWDGTTWVQLGTGIHGDVAGDWFGAAIAMSADGVRVATGADYLGVAEAGLVRVHDIDVSATTTTTAAPTTSTRPTGGDILPETGAATDGALLGAIALASGLALVAAARRRTV